MNSGLVTTGRAPLEAGPWGSPGRAAGSAFVELTLVVGFLFVMLLGTVDLSFLLLDYNALTKRVRSAAGFASVHLLDPATGKVLPKDAAAPGCPGQSFGQLVSELVRCGRCPCPSSSGPGPDVTLAYCVDHDDWPYVIVSARHWHAFSPAVNQLQVLGPGTTLSATAFMRIPSKVDRNALASLPSCQR